MKKSILMPVLVILVCAIVLFSASLALGSVRDRVSQEAHVQLMKTLLPGSESFVLEPYEGDDANIRSVHAAQNGVVVETVTAGYAGDITMFIGVDNSGRVTGLVVWDMEETRTLGGKALTNASFLSQYLHATGEAVVGEGIDALSGATVTSNAVTRCVNSAVAYVTGADVSSGATS